MRLFGVPDGAVGRDDRAAWLTPPFAATSVAAPLATGVVTAVTIKLDIAASAATGGTAPIRYQWYASTTSGFTPGAGNLLPGQTGRDLSGYVVATGQDYYVARRATDSSGTPQTADARYTASAVAGASFRRVGMNGGT